MCKNPTLRQRVVIARYGLSQRNWDRKSAQMLCEIFKLEIQNKPSKKVERFLRRFGVDVARLNRQQTMKEVIKCVKRSKMC